MQLIYCLALTLGFFCSEVRPYSTEEPTEPTEEPKASTEEPYEPTEEPNGEPGCVAKTAEECRHAAIQQGLIFTKKVSVGLWKTHAGCYAYKYGNNAGQAYFNNVDGERTTKLTLPKYRLNCSTAVDDQEDEQMIRKPSQDLNYCAWTDANGKYALRGGGLTLDECLSACILRGDDCNFLTFFHSSRWCHQFKYCKHPTFVNYPSQPVMFIKTERDYNCATITLEGKKDCQFPFEYKGVTYDKCAPMALWPSGPTLGISWCATDNKKHPENKGWGFTNWGICKNFPKLTTRSLIPKGQNRCCLGQCAVDCEWDVWSSWTECTASCDTGTTERGRDFKVEAKHGGFPCQGNTIEVKDCNTQKCPVHCKLGDWSEWTACSQTCGGGNSTRERDVQVQAKFGGTECQGHKNDSVACNTQPCPVDCEWHEWSTWTDCTATCGLGSRTRSRDKKDAAHGGVECEGENNDSEDCKIQNCDPGWYVADPREGCDTACQMSKGLICTAKGLKDHNSDVDSPQKAETLIKTLDTEFTATPCKGEHGMYSSVPNFSKKSNNSFKKPFCFSSSPNKKIFSCSDTPGPAHEDKQRLCYCQACVEYSVEACEAALEKLGYKKGGKGYKFQGNYQDKGCYAYTGGYGGVDYSGHGYYGTGGTAAQMKEVPDKTKTMFRPQGYDCPKA